MSIMQGFINVYKPSNVSSAKIVSKVKHLVGCKKVGHMGTLDPMACGVLPIAVNKDTKMFDYFLEKVKSYRAIFTFGYETDTLDKLGEIKLSGGKVPNANEINDVLTCFLGNINQIPPEYSAKNINGVRAYKLARSGQKVELKPKQVNILNFELTKQIDENSFEFIITCSSGTYIRALCRDLAYKLNTYATMTFLERTHSGVFNIKNSVNLDEVDQESIKKHIIPIYQVFNKFHKIQVNENHKTKLLNGLSIGYQSDDMQCFVFYGEELLGLAEVKDKKLKLKVHLL